MVCRQCGTEIAAKAIICYKCGTATAAEPVKRASSPPSPARMPAYVKWLIMTGLAGGAIAAWWWLQ